jgi:small GTP-binding protein
MTDQQKSSKKKPREILELEKAYGIIDESSDSYSDMFLNKYALNSNGNVIELSLFFMDNLDISLINNLKDLETLDLIDNSIKDISCLFPLPSLKRLCINSNLISNIYPILLSPKITQLSIDGNPIQDFAPIGQLKELQDLGCNMTNLERIDFIHELKKLRIIHADRNNISSIDEIEFLSNLEYVSFKGNQITEIPALNNLNNLQTLDLEHNSIRKIPKEIAKKFNWLYHSIGYHLTTEKTILSELNNVSIHLSGNPLTFPPVSVIELGPETVKNYYETAEEFGHAPLSEGRILFVGDGSSGKTSLIERIQLNTFDKDKKQTNGIKIEHLHLPHPEDGRDLAFHLWDFGGQEIQHAVHKFFFTEGCLYVLVLDNRKEEEPEYWLQQIESLGGKAPVLVVFNKQDQNGAETADRKYLKEKYPNIVGFYNTSCATGFGIDDFKRELERQAVQLRTVEEEFPNNWFAIKKEIEKYTSGKKHYLNYDSYKEICKTNHLESEEAQKLLLRYFNTMGTVTWFGDTYLNYLHVLNPAWITQGVYKIITARKTATLFGQINIGDFKELLHPINKEDYTYDENHYGYILSMMKKFDLCRTLDDETILIPSAFGKEPKMEYSDFRGDKVRTYILQFRDYMPLALIHRYIAKKLPEVYQNNYWYSGIVTCDCKTDSLAMIHADKEAKRIYVRIKGDAPLGMWEHVRREFFEITSSYANIRYKELVALDEKAESTVDYEDLISHIQAGKDVYFHPKLKRDFYVGYLMGQFEDKESSLKKFESGQLRLNDQEMGKPEKLPQFVINILNNNSPNVTANVNTQINIDIDIQVVDNISNEVKGDANYLLEELKKLGESNLALNEALSKIIEFTNDAQLAQNSGEVKAKGWGRKLKGILQTLKSGSEAIKNIQDGGEAMKGIFNGIKELAQQFNLNDISELVKEIIG